MGITPGMIMMAVLTTATSVASAAYQQQSQQAAQKKQQDFQAAMLRRNAQIAEQHATLAEEEGREARRVAYDAAQQKRREAAQMIGRERAMSAFSGAQVDQGSALDLTGDIAERGAVDAFTTERAGDASHYRQQLRGWESRLQAEGQNIQAQALSMREPDTSSFLNTALRQGNNFFSMLKKGSPDTGKSSKAAT